MPSRIVKTKATKRNAPAEYWRLHEDFYKSIDLALVRTKAAQHGITTDYLSSAYKYAMFDYIRLSPDQQETYRLSGAGGIHRRARFNATVQPPRFTAATQKMIDHADFWPDTIANGRFPEGLGGAPNVPSNDAVVTQPPTNNQMTLNGNVLTHGQRVPGGQHNDPANTENDAQWTFVENLFDISNNLYDLAIQLWEDRNTGERLVVKHLGYKTITNANGTVTRILDNRVNWSHAHTAPQFFREAYVGYLLTVGTDVGAMQYLGSVVNRHPGVQCVRIAMQQARYATVSQLIRTRSFPYHGQGNYDEFRKILIDWTKVRRPQMTYQEVENEVINQGPEWAQLLRDVMALPARDSKRDVLAASLRNEIRRLSIPEDFIWHTLKIMVSCIQKLNASRYYHLDIKPDNIFLHDALDKTTAAPLMGGWAVETRLGDFGHAHSFADKRRPYVPTGTTNYRSKEQQKAARAEDDARLGIAGLLNKKSDVFSLGCVLWQMMDPHVCASSVQYVDPASGQFVGAEDYDDFDSDELVLLVPGLYSEPLVNVVKQCLKISFRDRPTPAALMTEFNDYIARGRIGAPGADHGMAILPEFFCTDICRKLRSDCSCRRRHLQFEKDHEWEAEFE